MKYLFFENLIMNNKGSGRRFLESQFIKNPVSFVRITDYTGMKYGRTGIKYIRPFLQILILKPWSQSHQFYMKYYGRHHLNGYF
jgi:hypothetical protein